MHFTLFFFEGKWLETLDLNVSTQTVATGWTTDLLGRGEVRAGRLSTCELKRVSYKSRSLDEFIMRFCISTGMSNEYYFIHKQECNKGWFQAKFDARYNQDGSYIATWMWPKI